MTTMPATAGRAEQTRARYPDDEGYVERDGVRIFWEVYGSGEPTVLLLPTWSIIHSRHWKAQIPYLARHARVLTFDGRGNGRSDRPDSVDAYAEREFAADALAVMDAAGVERAVVVGLSAGALWGVLLAAEHPERVAGAVFIAAAAPFAQHAARVSTPFDEPLESYEGWAKYNRHYWLEDYRDFLEFFFGQVFTEPHSTKQIEDCVGWGLETTPETLALTYLGRQLHDPAEFTRLCERIACPVLVIHGTEDAVRPFEVGAELARVTGGALVALEGSGHCPHARDPVRVNRLLREFVGPEPPPRSWPRGRSRRKRALYVSSPIGLGHARRDIAIARELRRLHPDLEIDWLAQHPVTAALDAAGERVHPASRAARERVAPHRVRVGRARPALLPGLAADGRDPRRQLHGLRRPGPRAAVRPVDRRRGLGDRLLPAREPGVQARRLRLADRLRRLAADARRRRTRGRPHGRLQRRDDRADRALPARARPRDLRRQPRRHRPRGVRSRAPGDRGVDDRALRLRRPRHRLRPGRRRRPRAAAGGARLRAGRAGLRRQRGRLGRRPRAARACDGRLPAAPASWSPPCA